MKFECTKVFNFEGAIRGMRNALESWEMIDSHFDDKGYFVIGKNDLRLMQILIKNDSSHRKFLRQILVSVDITAPLYWWKEADQYRIGVTTNSCSTMHKLASTPITKDCFEIGDYCSDLTFKDNAQREHRMKEVFNDIIEVLESLRVAYNETKDKRYWKELIRILPESWLQKRTITMNYENVLNMVRQRSQHRLTEWSVDFTNWTKTLPYAKELIFLN